MPGELNVRNGQTGMCGLNPNFDANSKQRTISPDEYKDYICSQFAQRLFYLIPEQRNYRSGTHVVCQRVYRSGCFNYVCETCAGALVQEVAEVYVI